jgi:hypothetical protein
MYSADRVFQGNIIVGIGRSTILCESGVTSEVYGHLDTFRLRMQDIEAVKKKIKRER